MATLSVGRRLRSERGAEIIEMALVTPIFLIIIAAMFDFGFLFRNWEVATNAAREGARIGLLPSYKCDDTSTDVKDRVDAYMASAGFNAAACIPWPNALPYCTATLMRSRAPRTVRGAGSVTVNPSPSSRVYVSGGNERPS